jgi:hypothetical protein
MRPHEDPKDPESKLSNIILMMRCLMRIMKKILFHIKKPRSMTKIKN